MKAKAITRMEFDAIADDAFRDLTKQFVRGDIETLRVAFERTGAGSHAWRAWRLARAVRMNPPAWVMNYIDDAAKSIESAETAADIAQAFRLMNPKGGDELMPKNADRQRFNDESLLPAYRAAVHRMNLAKAADLAALRAAGKTWLAESFESAPKSKAAIREMLAKRFGIPSGEAVRQRLRSLGEKV